MALRARVQSLDRLVAPSMAAERTRCQGAAASSLTLDVAGGNRTGGGICRTEPSLPSVQEHDGHFSSGLAARPLRTIYRQRCPFALKAQDSSKRASNRQDSPVGEGIVTRAVTLHTVVKHQKRLQWPLLKERIQINEKADLLNGNDLVPVASVRY